MAAATRQVEAQPEQLTNGQLALLSDLKVILRAVPLAIDKTWNDFQTVLPEAERERSRLEMCSNFEELIQTLLGDLVPVLTGAAASLVPVELEPVLQEYVEQAAPGKYRPILYSTVEFNYSIVPLPSAAEVLEHAGADSGEVTETQELLSVSSPAIGKDSIALHAILVGHEVGHLREWEAPVATGTGFNPPVPDKWKDSTGKVDLDHAEAFDQYVEFVGRWGEELVADIYSCLLLGPVALLALPEVIGSAAELEADSDTHPGTNRRIRLMAEFLLERGFGDVDFLGAAIKQYAEQTENAPDRPINLEETGLVEPAAEAWQVLRDRAATLRWASTNRIGVADVVTPAIWPAVLRARDLLKQGLPCGETWNEGASKYDPTSVPVMLNAAWLVKTHELGELAKVVAIDIRTTEGLGDVSHVLDQLVTKSIEIANHIRNPA